MTDFIPMLSTVELYKENMKFSIAHFTIFSATEREDLHGHNYTVAVALDVLVLEDGLAFDYRDYKEKIRNVCRSLNRTTLLPTRSRYLRVEEEENYYCAYFANEKLYFLKRDVTLLPLTNITVEELSRWFVEQLTKDTADLQKNNIQAITVKVFSGPGQCGSASLRWNSQG